jgi:hypothetical protein
MGCKVKVKLRKGKQKNARSQNINQEEILKIKIPHK